jgi:hypothetical protein
MSIHRCEYHSRDRIRLTCCLVAAGLLLSAVAAVRADVPDHRIVRPAGDCQVYAVAAPASVR